MTRGTRLALALVLCGCAAPPPPDRRPAGVEGFAVIGDYGSGSNDEDHVASLVKSWDPDFIVTVGDNNYPTGDRDTIDDHIGRFYSDFIGGYAGGYGHGSPVNRFWPSIGNHDRYSTPPLQPYLDYFPDLPNNRRYYDVALGDVHLFALDSNDPNDVPPEPDGVTPDSIQGQWLRQKLAASTSCLNVVYFHHPPYSSGIYAVATMRWPFQAWGADVVLTGHEHFFERLEVDGIPYLINGLGGEDRFGFDGTPDPSSLARFNNDFGALFVSVAKTAVTYEFHTVSGEVVDSWTVPTRCR